MDINGQLIAVLMTSF